MSGGSRREYPPLTKALQNGLLYPQAARYTVREVGKIGPTDLTLLNWGDTHREGSLWGLGQRLFFLHDGRTTDLLQAIQAHRSAASDRFRSSEANAVIDNFNGLSEVHKQDLLNFLRSL